MSLSVPSLLPEADTLTAALSYAEAGWYVLPIKQGSKHPGSVVGFAWHTHSTRDPEQITARWAGTDHGVALHVGRSGAVVLDVDRPDDMPDHLAGAVENNPPPMQTTRIADARRGHYIYTQPTGRTLGNGVGRLGGTWGEIRGLNGIIVVAPTRHSEPGGAYEWLRTGEVPELPPEISELLDDTTPAADAAPDHQVAAFLMAHNASTHPGDLKGWATLYRKRVAAGESRHDRMVSVLTGALKEARLGHYPAAEAARVLKDEFIQAVTSEPLDDSSQGAARSAAAAAGEWSGILAWSIAQAEATELSDIEQRHSEHSTTGVADLVDLIGPTPPPPVDGGNALQPHEEMLVSTDEIVTESTDPDPTWRPLDLTAYITGTHVPEVPSLLARNDGYCLLYAGRLHSMHGESESGKSLVAQAETASQIHASRDVVYIDFESDPATIVSRLLDMGCEPEAIGTHLTYIRPEASPYAVRELDEWKQILAGRYTLVVLDGVTDALGTFGSSTKDNDEIATWIRMVARPLATHTGAAVVLIDHVTKSSESRGRFALGGQSKMNALDGAAYVVEIENAIGKGMRGEITLRVAKDRPGSVRPNCGKWRATDRTQEAAKVIVDSTHGPIDITVEAPQERIADASENDDKAFRRTGLMEKISHLLEYAAEPVSRSRLGEMLHSEGSKARKETIIDALNTLIAEGYIDDVAGARGARCSMSVRPYRQKDDAASDRYEDPFPELSTSYPQEETPPVPPVPTCSGPVPGTGPSPVPGPVPGPLPVGGVRGTGRAERAETPGTTPPVPDDEEPRACRSCGEILSDNQLLITGQCSGCIGRTTP